MDGNKGSVFSSLLTRIGFLIALIFSVYLTACSFLYDVKMATKMNDIPMIESSGHGKFYYVAAALFMIVLSVLIYRFIDGACTKQRAVANGIRWGLTGIFICLVFWFIHASDGQLVPDDAGACYSCAQVIEETDNFAMLQKGGYLYRYPNLLGLVSLNRILFRIFGIGDVKSFFYLNGVLLCIKVWFGTSLIRSLASGGSYRRETAVYACEAIYILLNILFLPMIIYSGFRYGDLIAVTAVMVSLWSFVRFRRSGNLLYFTLTTLAMCIGMLLRENVMIFLIAATITLVLSGLSEKKLIRHLGLGLILILVPLAVVSLHQKYYEGLIGEKIVGIPYVAWIAMGMQDGAEGPGSYNGYNWRVYDGNGDTTSATEVSKAYIDERIQEFRKDPSAAVDFYHRKFVSQWADGEYGATHNISIGEQADPLLVKLIGFRDDGMPLHHQLYRFMDVIQFLICFGGCLFLFGRIADARSLFLPAVYFVGGVLFSLLWEGKSRYVIAYYDMFLLFSAMGYGMLARYVMILRDKYLKKS